MLQGNVLFVFEARVSAHRAHRAAHAAAATQNRRSLRLRRALWLDGYEVSAPEASAQGVGARHQVEVRHVSEMAPGVRLTLRQAEACNAWRDALTHATARGALAASTSLSLVLAAQPPAPAAVRDASTQADDEAPERAEAEAAHAAAAELAAAEAAQRAVLLTWQLADARAAAAAAEHAAAQAVARADALAAELAAMRSDASSVIPELPAPPAAPPPPSGGIDAVLLPGLPGAGDASPRTPQQRFACGPATLQAPRKARPTVWPAAAAHGTRRSLYRTEP